MTPWKQLQRRLALTAGMTLVVPTVAWSEEGQKPAAITSADQSAKAVKAIVPDVILGKDGSFTGSLIDGAKKPLAKTQVVLQKDGKLVSTAETSDKGEYTLTKLKPGSYQLVVQEQTLAVRLWTPAAAPAKALRQLDMAYVPDPAVVRAQFGYLDPVNTSLLILGVTGVVLGAVAVSKIDSLQGEVKKLKSP